MSTDKTRPSIRTRPLIGLNKLANFCFTEFFGWVIDYESVIRYFYFDQNEAKRNISPVLVMVFMFAPVAGLLSTRTR